MNQSLSDPEVRPSTQPHGADRAHEIDGIRGWASVSVMLFHVFIEMLSHVVPGLKNPITNVLFNGEYSVMVFFVLSGDALSSAYFSKRTHLSIDRLVVKRYFRLTLPVFVSCTGVYFLMLAGWDKHLQVMYLLRNQEWFGYQLRFTPNLYHLLSFSFIDVYANRSPDQSYNPFLWTMSIELVGSMLVFLYCYVWERLRNPAIYLIAAACWLLLLNSIYFTFAIGMILGYARHRGIVNRLRLSNVWKIVSWLGVLFAVGFIFITFDQHVIKPIVMVVASSLVFFIYINSLLANIASKRISRYLGRISFPLYLCHYWMLISVMPALIMSRFVSIGDSTQLVFIGLAVAILSLLIAHLLSIFEQWYLRFVDQHLMSLLKST